MITMIILVNIDPPTKMNKKKKLIAMSLLCRDI